jgi:hypothetical protein
MMKASTEIPAASVNGSSRVSDGASEAHPANQAAAPPKKKGVGAQPKATPRSKTQSAARRPAQSSRPASTPEKLVCRYCGSDDLAPSFKKRRDARCRACFKQRYSSRAQQKKRTPARKAETAK